MWRPKCCHGARAKKIVAAAADDVVAWNQHWLPFAARHLRCSAAAKCRRNISRNCWRMNWNGASKPSRAARLPGEHAAAIASRRAIYEVRAAHSPETRGTGAAENSTAWTVVFEADPRFQLSCLNRFIYVKPAADLTEALQSADAVRGKVSTVGVAAPEERDRDFRGATGAVGRDAVCPLGRMQNPPLAWRHDGRPALGDLSHLDGFGNMICL